MWWVERRHVVPLDDFREHALSSDCWCLPMVDDDIVIHQSMDGREAYENGERKPN